MKPLSTACCAVVVCSLPLAAQEPRTGVSMPPPAVVDTTNGAQEQAVTPGYQPTPAPALVRRDPATRLAPPPLDRNEPLSSQPARDVDAGIVTDVPHAVDELPAGTTFRARMRQSLSTETTQSGTPFSAELIEAVQQDGRTLIPSGTILEGQVTEVRGGRRIHGVAALHLDPRTFILPDGTRHTLRAQVIDTSQSFATRIDSEGTIVRRDHIKATLAVMGATTGAAAVAGAVVGGGVGAVVGAGIGAGISTAWWLKQDRQTVLPEETAVVFSLTEPLTIGSSLR